MNTVPMAVPELALPLRTPRLLRVAGKVFTRGPAITLRQWRKRVLRSDYLRGAAAANDTVLEGADPAIIRAGRRLRRELMHANAGKHAGADYRALMLRPPSITAEIWFGDLGQCLQHAGIDCSVLPPGTPAADINAALEEFRPNVFVASESTATLRDLDLAFLHRYKRAHGCLRMFIPAWHAHGPRENVTAGGRSTPAEDEWRRELRARGLIADAHFSIFESEFHHRFSRDPHGPEVDYLALPQACNPFNDYPVDAPKQHDYFMATTMTDDRVEVSYRYLRPVLQRYRGLWAGARWGFGERGVPLPEMPLRYAQARIALSPLVGFVHHYAAELTHRVYAAAACGAFQITMPTAITDRFFSERELVRAASPAEYARLFDHYVSRPDERNAIALAALRRVYGEHSCFHRIDKLVAHWDEWRRRGLF